MPHKSTTGKGKTPRKPVLQPVESKAQKAELEQPSEEPISLTETLSSSFLKSELLQHYQKLSLKLAVSLITEVLKDPLGEASSNALVKTAFSKGLDFLKSDPDPPNEQETPQVIGVLHYDPEKI